MKKYKALLFDFDDTLFDFKKSEHIALKATFEKYQIAFNEQNIALYIAENLAFWRGFEKGLYKGEGDSAIRFHNFCRKLGRAEIDYREMCEYYIDRLSETAFPIENSVELLKKLSATYDIYIVTNALQRVNRARSRVAGITPFIKGTFISEAIGFSKPNKGYFDYCFSHMEATKEEALLIGDSLRSDIKGALDYGIDCCWFNPKGLENSENCPPTYEIRSLHELEELL